MLLYHLFFNLNSGVGLVRDFLLKTINKIIFGDARVPSFVYLNEGDGVAEDNFVEGNKMTDCIK